MNDLRYASYILVPAIPVAFLVWVFALAGSNMKKEGRKVMSEVNNAEKTREVCMRYVNSGKEQDVMVKGFPVNKTTDWFSKFSNIPQKYTLDFSGGTYWDSYVGEFVGNGFEVQEKFDEGQNACFESEVCVQLEDETFCVGSRLQGKASSRCIVLSNMYG